MPLQSYLMLENNDIKAIQISIYRYTSIFNKYPYKTYLFIQH